MKKLERIFLLFVVTAFLFFIPQTVSAVFIDLTPEPVVEVGYDNNIFANGSLQSSGSGVIDPFVRISSSNAGHGDLSGDYRTWGYNTGFTSDFELFNVEATDPFTRELLLSEVPLVEIEGILYRELLLDINEPKNDNMKYLSVEELQIYLFNAPDVNDFNILKSSADQLVWDLDGIGDSWIGLDYSHHSGSGESDMYAYINEQYFQTARNELGFGFDYVYLFSHFGALDGTHSENDISWKEQADYEEWAVRESTAPIPEPSTILLLGIGLIGLGVISRKKLSI